MAFSYGPAPLDPHLSMTPAAQLADMLGADYDAGHDFERILSGS